MTSRILAILGSFALPATALAHTGHIADTGQGHAHWYIYVLLGAALFGFALWTRKTLTRRATAKRH